MTTATGTRPTAAARRLAGVDAARGLARAGLWGVHLAPGRDGSGTTLAHEVFGGRASALCAVRAGVGIALASGGAAGPARGRLPALRRGLAARAGVVAVVGLTLAAVYPTPVAIILAYYGVLFLLALPVLGWGPRRLAAAAGVSVVVAPVVSHLVRSATGDVKGPSTAWPDLLLRLPDTVSALLVSGYYPVLTWSAYLFLGLAVGRLPLRAGRTAALLAAGGAALAALGWALGALTLRLAGGALGPDPTGRDFFGTTPTDSWGWLGLRAPHLGSAPDLLHTGGCAVAVLGVMLLLAPRARVVLQPLVAAGSMTLTLYTLHVLAVGWADRAGVGLDVPGRVWALHVAVALLLATAWGSRRRRGPLEHVAHAAARAVA